MRKPTRSPRQVMEAIAAASPEEISDLHERVENSDMPDARKADLHKLFMLLAMVGEMGKPKAAKN